MGVWRENHLEKGARHARPGLMLPKRHFTQLRRDEGDWGEGGPGPATHSGAPKLRDSTC